MYLLRYYYHSSLIKKWKNSICVSVSFLNVFYLVYRTCSTVTIFVLQTCYWNRQELGSSDPVAFQANSYLFLYKLTEINVYGMYGCLGICWGRGPFSHTTFIFKVICFVNLLGEQRRLAVPEMKSKYPTIMLWSLYPNDDANTS